jgi:hypothetical protein
MLCRIFYIYLETSYITIGQSIAQHIIMHIINDRSMAARFAREREVIRRWVEL